MLDTARLLDFAARVWGASRQLNRLMAERLGGYEVNISEEQLRGAPKFSEDEDWDWSDRERARRISDYYGTTPYWM